MFFTTTNRKKLLLFSTLAIQLSIVAVPQEIILYLDQTSDAELLDKALYRCATGSISIDANGVCINTLTTDNLSTVDGIVQTLLTETFSTTDAVIEQGTIDTLSATDVLIDNSFTVSSFISNGVIHNDTSGSLSSSLIINTDVDPAAAIVDTKLATISTAGKVANSATTATNSNTASTIVVRDASGNFSAGTITANLSGNATTATATTNFSGSLVGDVTGTQGATVVSTVGGQTAANVATATVLANAATSANTPNTLVLRNGSGNFSAGTLSIADGIASGNLVLDQSSATVGNINKGSDRFIHNFGTSNTFVGVTAGNLTTSGTGQNSAFGKNALIANTTGANNTVIGFNALSGCTTGSTNVAIGSGTGTTLTTGNNNIYILANAATNSESNTIRIGVQGSQTTCFIAGVRGTVLTLSGLAVVVDSSGQLGTVLSSEKFKRHIKNMNKVSENILKLRPVTFTYNSDTTDTEQFGLVAEEVAKVFPAIVVNDENGQPLSVQYHVLPVLLLNEMQKQQATIEQMQDIIAHLHNRVESFVERLKTMENKFRKNYCIFEDFSDFM